MFRSVGTFLNCILKDTIFDLQSSKKYPVLLQITQNGFHVLKSFPP